MIPFLPSLLGLLCLVCVPAQGPEVEVLAGSGEVPAATLSEVRRFVDAGLESLTPMFPGLVVGRFAVFVHESGDLLPQSLASLRHPGAPGFALLGRHQLHLVIGDMRRSGATLGGVVRHELVHELLDQFAARRGGRIPRWFHEGLAQHLAGETYLGATEADLVWRVGVRRLLSFGDLREGFPHDEDELRVAYAQSHSYVSWLVRRFGIGNVVGVAGVADTDTTFDVALVWQTGKSTLALYDAWTDYLVYGSGAWWRVLLDQCFNALMILALPALAVAWWRRRARARLIARRMAEHEARFPMEFEFDVPPEAVAAPPADEPVREDREPSDNDGPDGERGG